MSCALAADTKLETPEGPLTVKTVGASPTPVMVRIDGRNRFAMSRDVRLVAAAQPVLRIALENGRALRLGADQVLLGPAGSERRAGDLQAGDALLCAFAFPVGYAYRTDDGEARVSDGCVSVASIADGGSADLYSLAVGSGAPLVLACGLVGRAAG
ncbi:hypothetical protein KF840_19600 [bacterium]|nr:hypothetical protein [bacterium]